MASDHSILTFDYFQLGKVNFNKTTIKAIHIVDAFSKKFIFYYKSDATTKMIYFLIYLLGRNEDAQKMYYEFQIIHPENKIKHVSSFLYENIIK